MTENLMVLIFFYWLYRESLHVHICARPHPAEWQWTHFSGGGSKVFWWRIKSFLVEDQNFSGGGSQIQCRAWWLIPEQRCWGMIMVSASNLKDINHPGVLDRCFKNNVPNFCADWTRTIYLHVCSQAQDWSIDSQFSVTSSVQHGLSYCSICTLAQN